MKGWGTASAGDEFLSAHLVDNPAAFHANHLRTVLNNFVALYGVQAGILLYQWAGFGLGCF